MPRNFFKKISPTPQKVTYQPQLGWLQEKIKKPGIWGYTRTNITRAVIIGLFWAMIPIPLQMIAAALCAYRFSANIPVSIALVWITNPFTIPIIFYLQYLLGHSLLDLPTDPHAFEMSWQWVKGIIAPFSLGVAVCALVVPTIGYVTVNQLWIWRVQRTRKKNQANINN